MSIPLFPKPFFDTPAGDIRVETPDGITWVTGEHVHDNLIDRPDQRPAIQSGDWQIKPPFLGLKPRGRP